MDNPEDLLSFFDLLDLDEEIIDNHLKHLMLKSKHLIKHLKGVVQLLQYKMQINIQEGTDCENEEEFNFVVKLLKELTVENVDYVCKIINIVLCLNATKILSKAEHLLQQILSNIEFQSETQTNSLTYDTNVQTLLSMKATESILNATLKKGVQVSLLFLETPLEKILDSTNETLKVYFLTNTVPRLVDGVTGYNILDRLWAYIQNFKGDRNDNALKVLSCLSDYYLPTPNAKGDSRFASNITFQYSFWNIVLYGINSTDGSVRKISVYLLKKAIDSVMYTKKDVNVKSMNHTIFHWKNNQSNNLKTMWYNYFVLIDSLDEKQANIVLPSLRLFENIDIGDCWINSAFKMGLQHDNTQVRLKCIEYRFKTKIRNQSEAQILLEALNDINIYDQSSNYDNLKVKMKELLNNPHSFTEIFKAVPLIKWSPIPFYHFTDILADLKINDLILGNEDVCKIILDIFKIPCNNVALRKAVQINLVYFIKNCCNNLNWNEIASIYSVIRFEISSEENPFTTIVKRMSLTIEEKVDNLKTMSEHYNNIDFIKLYLRYHEEDIGIFMDIINKKLKQIQETLNRQYSDKKEYVNEVTFLLHLLSKTRDEGCCLHSIHELIARQNKTLIQYILSLFSNEVNLTIEEVKTLFENHEYEFVDKDLGVILLQLYKTAILMLKDNPELDKAILSIFALKMLLENTVMLKCYGHEMLNLKKFIELISNLEFRDTLNESVGRSKNVFYEKSCAIICLLIKEDKEVESCLTEVTEYIENVLECGGYGCLKWILKIVNKIIVPLTNDEAKFNMVVFINRVWNEIEELKSNNQYSPCIEEFVELITQDALLKKSVYNNIVILYCNKIIEYGPVKTNPLYYLIRKLSSKDLKDYGHLIYVLCDILLYCPVPRKDQRISDNVTLEVLQNPKYGIDKESIDIHFNYEIQYLSIATLCNIHDTETLRMIKNFITIRIDNAFKYKQRYHGNSHLHRILQIALQHILMLVLKSGDMENMLNWCLDLLVKLPHQPSVRVCIEWFVSLYFYAQKTNVSEEMLQIFKSKNVPLTSQFFIMYWLLKHKISNNTYTEEEYNFVLDFVLSHTMGQLFNVRLNAQYLATKLYKQAGKTTKYEYTIGIIEKTFTESNSDKNFLKLVKDYFTNDFDIVANLSPYFIYYLLPKFCDVDNNENVDVVFIKRTIKDISHSISRSVDNEFISEWKSCRKVDDRYIEMESNKCVDNKIIEDSESMGTIQKKYIPWRNMSDVNVYDVEKKSKCPSQLIVVASLIDKLPNLGGMARTSEVFGVQTYVVDSLRHLQDKQFQGLSVSAERWINVEEVRPGRPLKEYLMRKKEEGYSVVAAEQTSTSSKLQTFKFPKKTLLLLGHEKEGIPCDLLPLMDHCVEIPQQGFVRSLNVHVTAAIFVWEYARQNVLSNDSTIY